MPREREVPPPADVLRAAYGAFDAVVVTITDERSWLPTGCAGWSVRDLVFHCLADAQRGLVALHTPAERAPDRDAVSYWADWGPDPLGAANGRRFNRVVASMFLHVEQLCGLYSE
ncbi:maleylpyruvate isomerase N-terminal domain-containing protein, partial [Streptomyces sp. NPDC054838]